TPYSILMTTAIDYIVTISTVEIIVLHASYKGVIAILAIKIDVIVGCDYDIVSSAAVDSHDAPSNVTCIISYKTVDNIILGRSVYDVICICAKDHVYWIIRVDVYALDYRLHAICGLDS